MNLHRLLIVTSFCLVCPCLALGAVSNRMPANGSLHIGFPTGMGGCDVPFSWQSDTGTPATLYCGISPGNWLIAETVYPMDMGGHYEYMIIMTLQADTTYFWKIDNGDVWSFTTVYTPPVITDQPQPLTVTAGQTADLTAQFESATDPTVMWYRDGVPFSAGDVLPVPGPMMPSYLACLTIENAQPSHIGSYHCVVTNAGGTAVSESARLIVEAVDITGEFYWQALKIHSENAPGFQYGLSIRVRVPYTTACLLKGPLMADFTAATWSPAMEAWDLLLYPLSLAELQQRIGTWQVKLDHLDGRRSVEAFTVSGALAADSFLPIPNIHEPAPDAAGLVAQDTTLRWNPNGAHLNAHLLFLEFGGEDCHYFRYLSFMQDDRSITEWRPGWLGLGAGYAKIGYVWVRSDMMQPVTHVSGPAVTWNPAMVFLVSGDRHEFTVRYSLDLNEDDRIDLADLSVFSAHWLETR